MKETKIEWADSTANLQMGCAGCELWNPEADIKLCYAGLMTERYAGNIGWPKSFEEPEVFSNRLEAALRWPDLTGKIRINKPWLSGLPRIVFLNDMGDTFSPGLPMDWLAPFLQDLADSSHQWLILTKQPQRMLEFSKRYPFPPNVWPGVSVTSQANFGRTTWLEAITSGGPKWVSYEPALGPVDWSRLGANVSWLIAGGLSGGSAATHIDWLRAALSDRATFIKQLGSRVRESYYMDDDSRREWLIDKTDLRQGRILVPGGKPGSFVQWEHRTHGQPAPGSVFEWKAKSKGGDMSEWPEWLQIREMPIKVARCGS